MRVAVLALALAVSGHARADGAFPDSAQIMVPADLPHRVAIGTNFGLLVSEDDGASWSWICEQAIAPCARLYQMTAAPVDAVVAVSGTGLVILGDDLCGAASAAGPFLPTAVTDAFVDPSDARRVLAIALLVPGTGQGPYGILESHDGGLHFATIYQAPDNTFLSGVEIARSDPATVYAALGGFGANPLPPTILRSQDGGTSFASFDQSATLGDRSIAIAGVDPTDARRIFLRVTDRVAAQDSLGVSDDGGVTTRIALTLPAGTSMTAFLKRADGSILVTGVVPKGSGACGGYDLTGDGGAVGYLSTDGAATFAPWPNVPHVRAMAERAGTLYVVANNFADGFAVGTSTDQGAHFTPILHFNQIGGPLACPRVQAACATAWTDLMKTFGIGDMGAGDMGGSGGGGGCAIAPRAPWLGGAIAMLLAWAAWLARRRGAAR